MTIGESITVMELFLLSQDPHDQSRFHRRRAVPLFGRHFWLPSPEDVIITKLRWARGKDKDDARDVMAVQRDKLDWPYIEDLRRCIRFSIWPFEMRAIRDAGWQSRSVAVSRDAGWQLTQGLSRLSSRLPGW